MSRYRSLPPDSPRARSHSRPPSMIASHQRPRETRKSAAVAIATAAIPAAAPRLDVIDRGRISPPAHSEDAQEEAREDRLEPERRQRHAGDDPAHRAAVVEV